MAGDLRRHRYEVTVEWTGNLGEGTASYTAYERSHSVRAAGKTPIAASSDPSFRGDPARWNPEEMLVASLSACHKLWYLHLCAQSGVIVTDYVDSAVGEMEEQGEQGGRFVLVTLHPCVTITAGGDEALAAALHQSAHEKCFVANSVNFPVICRPRIIAHATMAG